MKFLLSLCFLALSATFCLADDFNYYVVVFSCQNKGKKIQPALTHTFASWVKAKDNKIVDQVDISWGPADGEARFVTHEVPGTNRSVKDAINRAKGKDVFYWTLKTDKDFFE